MTGRRFLTGRPLLTGLVFGVALNAQAQQPSFKSGVELVRIPLNVAPTDATAALGQLAAGDFSITEDGVAQEVAVFERESLPISLCVVLDVSESMAEATVARRAMDAFRRVVNSLAEDDELAVVTFAADVSVAVPWTAAAAARKLSLTFASKGGTAIVDGVRGALRQIDKSKGRRPVILVITDGGENSSRTSLSRVVATRRQSETQLYALRIVPPPPPKTKTVYNSPRIGGVDEVMPSAPAPATGPRSTRVFPSPAPPPDVLPGLVDDSGGLVYHLANDHDGPGLVRRFLEEIRSQYTIGYSPLKPMDGQYRRIKVETTRQDIRVRHRGGYLALPSGATR